MAAVRRTSLGRLAAALVCVLSGAVGLLVAAPVFTMATAYDTVAYNYDATTRLSTSHASDGPERASRAGPGVASLARSVSVGGLGDAANSGIGFADDAVGSAYQGMRSGGGHAIRHLRDEGLISNSGSLASQVSQFEKLTSPILRSPTSTFDWRLGNTMTRGFAGEVGGRQVVVFVAKEGPYQGRILSAVVPDASQPAQWGLP